MWREIDVGTCLERIAIPDADDKIMLISQITGSSRFFTLAHTQSFCSHMERDDASRERSVSLDSGDMLIVTNFPEVRHEVSLQTRNLKTNDDSSQLNVVLIFYADVNYHF